MKVANLNPKLISVFSTLTTWLLNIVAYRNRKQTEQNRKKWRHNCTSILKMTTLASSEMLLTFYQSMRRHINLHIQDCEDPKYPLEYKVQNLHFCQLSHTRCRTEREILQYAVIMILLWFVSMSKMQDIKLCMYTQACASSKYVTCYLLCCNAHWTQIKIAAHGDGWDCVAAPV